VQAVGPAAGRITATTAVGALAALGDHALREGDPCILCVRPENVAFDATVAGDNQVRGRIAFAAYLGNALRYDVELAPGLVFKVDIRDPWHHEQRPLGESVSLSFPAASTVAIAGTA
jgi:hypothetical protein